MMKRLFLLAATLMVAWGCETAETDDNTSTDPNDESTEPTVSSDVSIVAGAPQSRVALTEDASSGELSATWVEGDALGAWVYNATSFVKLEMEENSISADGATATFEGSGVSGDYRVIHPYIESAISGNTLNIDLTEQTADLDDDGFNNIGASTYIFSDYIEAGSTSTELYHLGAVLNFEVRFVGLTQSGLTITNLKVSNVANSASIRIDDMDVDNAISANIGDIDIAVVNSPEIVNYGQDATVYPIKCSVLPFTLPSKSVISVEVTFNDGSSEVVDITLSSKLTLERSTYTTYEVVCDMTPSYMEIGSESDLEIFRDAVNAGNTAIDATLTADFALTTMGWEPIGSEDQPYAGTFDGAGYTISDLYVNCDGSTLNSYGTESVTIDTFGSSTTVSYIKYEYYNGLFGYTDGATIKNLTVQNGLVYGLFYSGSIVGYAVNTDIINCTGAVDCQAYRQFAGSVAGAAVNSRVIACVGNSSTVSNSKIYGSTVTDYYPADTKGNIFEAAGSDKNAAGLVCIVSNSDIIGCYSLGIVRTTANAQGGFVSVISSESSVSGSFAAAQVNKAGALGFASNSTGTTFNAAYWVSDIENLGLDNYYYDTDSTYDKATGTINNESDSTGAVESITASTLNTSATVNAMNAAIVAAGVTDYQFTVGTSTTYPTIGAK